MIRKNSFFEGWSWFKFNNLGLALGTNLKFYTSVAKGLNLKVRRILGLLPTFVEVTGEKLVVGAFLASPSWIRLRAKTTFKIYIFYSAQILTGTVEKQPVVTPFNFFFKFSYFLNLFLILSVHLNWIVFSLTAQFFKFYYQHILH